MKNDSINKSRSYFQVYGGMKALFTSRYLWLAFAVNLLAYNVWLSPNWWADVISILPGMLGFSLGGYAMFVSVGNDEFKKALSKVTQKGNSIFMSVNAMFVHFIVVQLIGTIYALINKSLYFEVSDYSQFGNIEFFDSELFGSLIIVNNFFGYWLFIYALLTAIAATFGIYRLSRIYDKLQNSRLEIDKQVERWKVDYIIAVAANEDFRVIMAKLIQSESCEENVTDELAEFGKKFKLIDDENKFNKKGLFFKALLLKNELD